MPRSDWLVERNFASVKNMVNIPLDEVNKKVAGGECPEHHSQSRRDDEHEINVEDETH